MSRGVVTPADLPIGGAEHPAGDRDEQENAGKDAVGLEREDEVGEQRETPDDQVQGDDGVVLFRGLSGDGVGAAGRVRRAQT